jgi:hypothetical protein
MNKMRKSPKPISAKKPHPFVLLADIRPMMKPSKNRFIEINALALPASLVLLLAVLPRLPDINPKTD